LPQHLRLATRKTHYHAYRLEGYAGALANHLPAGCRLTTVCTVARAVNTRTGICDRAGYVAG